MSFIDDLREEPWDVAEIPPGRVNLLDQGVITLLGLKRMESEALFVSSEGIGTLRETLKVDFAGKERYWLLARKINGVIRRVLLDVLKPPACSVEEPCISCPVCSLLGGLNPRRGRTQALFARLKMQDLISIEGYHYDEKFRIRLDERRLVEGRGTTPFQEVVVPPGTRFPFVVRLFKPTKFDLAAFLCANAVSDTLGYGNYTKLRGDASTDWHIMAEGVAFLSAFDLLSSLDTGRSIADWVGQYLESPRGLVREVISGDALTAIAESLISWFSEKYDITFAVSAEE